MMDATRETCYPEAEFVTAFGDAFVGQLAVAIPEGSTARNAARAVRNMRNPSRHEIILQGAFERLRRAVGVSVEEVQQSGGSVVATFAV